jgi:hypothetical protein
MPILPQGPDGPYQADVFLSYSHDALVRNTKDLGGVDPERALAYFVLALRESIARIYLGGRAPATDDERPHIWYDGEGTEHVADLEAGIKRMVTGAGTFVALASREYLHRRWCIEEFAAFYETQRLPESELEANRVMAITFDDSVGTDWDDLEDREHPASALGPWFRFGWPLRRKVLLRLRPFLTGLLKAAEPLKPRPTLADLPELSELPDLGSFQTLSARLALALRALKPPVEERPGADMRRPRPRRTSEVMAYVHPVLEPGPVWQNYQYTVRKLDKEGVHILPTHPDPVHLTGSAHESQADCDFSVHVVNDVIDDNFNGPIRLKLSIEFQLAPSTRGRDDRFDIVWVQDDSVQLVRKAIVNSLDLRPEQLKRLRVERDRREIVRLLTDKIRAAKAAIDRELSAPREVDVPQQTDDFDRIPDPDPRAPVTGGETKIFLIITTGGSANTNLGKQMKDEIQTYYATQYGPKSILCYFVHYDSKYTPEYEGGRLLLMLNELIGRVHAIVVLFGNLDYQASEALHGSVEEMLRKFRPQSVCQYHLSTKRPDGTSEIIEKLNKQYKEEGRQYERWAGEVDPSSIKTDMVRVCSTLMRAL